MRKKENIDHIARDKRVMTNLSLAYKMSTL